jgi:hypothetical protein
MARVRVRVRARVRARVRVGHLEGGHFAACISLPPPTWKGSVRVRVGVRAGVGVRLGSGSQTPKPSP